MLSDVRDNFTVTFSSDGSEVFAHQNSHSDFRIKFPSPLQLNKGKWSVGLTSVQYSRYIANLDSSCFMKVWNGSQESSFTFPRWSCPSIQQLLTFIKQFTSSVRYTSTGPRRIEMTRTTRNVLDEDDIRNGSYKPARHLERRALEEMFQQFGYSPKENFPWDKISDSSVDLPSLTTSINEMIRYFDIKAQKRDDSSTLLPGEAKLAENKTLASSIMLFKELYKGPIILPFDEEPAVYEPPNIENDILGRLRINSVSPDFDFCLSDNLRIKLGFTETRFSVESYNRRRLFPPIYFI